MFIKKKNVIIQQKYRYSVYLLLASILVTVFCSVFYQISGRKNIQVKEFQKTLATKQGLAEKKIKLIENTIIHSSTDSLSHLKIGGSDISFWVTNENGMPVYWTDNQTDISNHTGDSISNWHFVKLPNAYGILKISSLDNLTIVTYINIKHNYPYENKSLVNDFTPDFKLHKLTELKYGSKKDEYPVYSYNGDYLFSLIQPDYPVYSSSWGMAGFVASLFSLFMLLRIYLISYRFNRKKHLTIKQFGFTTAIVSILILASLLFNTPSLLYWNELFSSAEYSSGALLTSIGHLSVLSALLLTVIYVFYSYVKFNKTSNKLKHIALTGIFGLYYLLLYYVLSSIVSHSSIQLIALKFNDISAWGLLLHLVIFSWGIGLALLFYKTHNWFKSNNLLKKALLYDIGVVIISMIIFYFIFPQQVLVATVSLLVLLAAFYTPYFWKYRINIYGLAAFLTLVYALFFITNILYANQLKTKAKFRIVAENINMSGSSENDPIAEILLEELDIQLQKDPKLSKLSIYSDSIEKINRYLNENYLRGFWNKYEMRLNIALKGSGIESEYYNYAYTNGRKLRDSHFFSIPASYNTMTYMGLFRRQSIEGDSLSVLMEFYPRKNFRSYSFPNLLINSVPDIQSQLKIAIAKYEGNNLIYSSGKYEFPKNGNWIPASKKDFFRFNSQNQTYFVYTPNKNTRIVITETEPHGFLVYLLYSVYVIVIFAGLSLLIIWLSDKRKRKEILHPGFTSRFQYAFLALLILSFLGIFYVSVDFIRQKYEDEQIKNIETKKMYIRNALQEMYYWIQDLSVVDQQRLNLDLQELSYMYQTDIHVYDNYGMLMGSSQPLIFNKNLISRQISPRPFFATKDDLIMQEHIGKLKYLTGYTDFYNGDYLQIGYIAVPQFLSEEEIRNEIESYLSVIIHIYLIIIILAVFLSFFIGKQLSAPLTLIENKLREMRFGHRNEKIDYNLHDEIGQLVAQYNRTVDELEKSARLLAQSERETAWKTMARQIAHEINNPLTPMKLTIQQLQRTKKMNDERFDDYFEKSTQTLTEQIDNLSRIAGTFSNFARMPEAKFSKVDIAAKVSSVVQLFANNHERTELTYNGPASDVFVYADPEQLTQVFNNLLKNAIQAIPSDRIGQITVNVIETKAEILIDVEDNGNGIADEVAEKLFMPNFTTKSAGMGLGLTISKNIIEIAGGTISFTTRAGVGTTFRVMLPKES